MARCMCEAQFFHAGICDACSVPAHVVIVHRACMPSVYRATAYQVIGTTRLIQITSAAFGALLVPLHTVTLLPIEAVLVEIPDSKSISHASVWKPFACTPGQSLNSSISVINWLGLVLCVTSAVMYFKAQHTESQRSSWLPAAAPHTHLIPLQLTRGTEEHCRTPCRCEQKFVCF